MTFMRIVSLSPSFTEIVTHIGAADLLVGCTDFNAPFQGKAVSVGSPKALDLPKIASLQPDCVLADSHENRPEELREIEKRFRLLRFDVRTVEQAADAVWTVGRLVGRSEAAANVGAAIREEIEKSRRDFCDREPVRAVILFWHQPYVTVNFDTYASRLLEASGAVNVFREDPIREFPVELEDMIEKGPDVLLLPSEPFPFQGRHVDQFRKYRLFSKIRIELVDGRLFSRYGPRTVDALRALRGIFHGIKAPAPR